VPDFVARRNGLNGWKAKFFDANVAPHYFDDLPRCASRESGLATPRVEIQNLLRIIMETLDQRQSLEAFGQLVLDDRELHGRLRAATDEKTFVALAVRLGAERGFDFTAAIVETALRERRRAWLERWL
jgi:hypothetical protein